MGNGYDHLTLIFTEDFHCPRKNIPPTYTTNTNAEIKCRGFGGDSFTLEGTDFVFPGDDLHCWNHCQLLLL